MVHHCQHVVVRESLPAHHHHGGLGFSGVELANVVIGAVAALVGIVVLGDCSEQRDVGEGERFDGSLAASGSSTVERVGGAADQLAMAEAEAKAQQEPHIHVELPSLLSPSHRPPHCPT